MPSSYHNSTTDLLKKVRKIEIRTKALSHQIFAGEYHSAFKGRGMAFSEVREYQWGDDVRSMDWNVTARLRTPYIKVFEEERELTVVLLVDVSRSGLFGTAGDTKRERLAEIAAVLSYSAILNNDKVGALFFSDHVEKFITPKKGRTHLLHIIREMLELQPTSDGTDIGAALRFLTNGIKKKCTAFLLSDMLDVDAEGNPDKTGVAPTILTLLAEQLRSAFIGPIERRAVSLSEKPRAFLLSREGKLFMTDTFRSIFSLTAAGSAGRGAFFAGTILFVLLSTLLSYFVEDGLSFEHYVAWVTTEDIQVTFVASLEEYAALVALLLAAWFLFWGYWMLVMRRLHDLGYHGVASLYLLLPGINVIVTLILCVWPGRRGRNRFGGEDPVEVYEGVSRPNGTAGVKEPDEAAVPRIEASDEAPRLTMTDEEELPPEALALLKKLEGNLEGENLTIRLQLKVQTVEKLRKLVRNGKLSEEAFLRLERRVHAMGN